MRFTYCKKATPKFDYSDDRFVNQVIVSMPASRQSEKFANRLIKNVNDLFVELHDLVPS